MCDLNLKGDFQDQQAKTVLGESNRTGNLTEKQIADVFKQQVALSTPVVTDGVAKMQN